MLSAALTLQENVASNPNGALIELARDMGILDAKDHLIIPNVAPDEGISAPFNAWMTFFGQFFDHGLDLIGKGTNGTIYIPLQQDDPLYNSASPHTNFMVVTRATPVTGPDGVITQTNKTTPFVDQNQTYTSHASHQVFLREYAMGANGAVATGRLLEGTRQVDGNPVHGGLATWADVKAQAIEMLGIRLSDVHVHAVPLLATDAYGMFERGSNGYAQVLVAVTHSEGETVLKVEGRAGGLDLLNIVAADLPAGHGLTGITAISPIATGHAFLDDIAHNAAPQFVDPDRNPATPNSMWTLPDEDSDVGNDIPLNSDGVRTTYDNELLDRHFITGDGRGNENFGLTAVHHVFHSEHNRQVLLNKLNILRDGDLGFVNQWLLNPIAQAQLDIIKASLTGNLADAIANLEDGNLATGPAGINLNWNGERLFQTARFATEMQYQHLVFEEFARKVQPNIDVFIFNSVTDINPAIFSEFANTVYRFGHSMLTESMPRAFLLGDAGEDDNFLDTIDDGLIEAFLNPVAYDMNGGISHAAAAGAIVRGMTVERGNAIDEFVVDALRNSLLGLPLDLAAINIARGRDTGIPTLNQARAELFAATGQSFLKPYENWVEFAANLKNPLSIVNFIAAYGTHTTITSATTLAAKRDAAWELVFGQDVNGDSTVAGDRLDFLNARGGYAGGSLGGLNNVDLWIGGLAERILLFNGMLGSTFNAVFEIQLENLQDADRFYYLTRTQGLHFLTELENNAFSKLIMANTDLSDPGPDGIRGTDDDIIKHHIGIDSFANYDYILEVQQQYQRDYAPDDAASKDPNDIDATLAGLGLKQVNRDMPAYFDSTFYDNYLRFIGGEHVVLGGSAGNDILIGDLGDDSIWGGAGDDYIDGGQGVDLIMGGPGDDIILDQGDQGDFIKGDNGDDVIASSSGLDILMGGEGKDVIFAGADDTEVFGGAGDDFILGGPGVDFLLGNEGDDWIEGAGGFDTIAGDNSELFFNSRVIGHDVMFAGSDEQDFDAESGDDIMVQGESVIRNEGMFGFDWAIFKGVQRAADADLRVKIFTTEEEDILRNRFDKVEALSGWIYDDVLSGDDRISDVAPAGATVAVTENLFFRDELDQEGVDRIFGLDQIISPELMRLGAYGSDFSDDIKPIFTGGNILLGGGGSDTLMGRGGDDVLDGDAWLNVRIRITGDGQANTAGNQIATVDSLSHKFVAGPGVPAFPAAWRARPCSSF